MFDLCFLVSVFPYRAFRNLVSQNDVCTGFAVTVFHYLCSSVMFLLKLSHAKAVWR